MSNADTLEEFMRSYTGSWVGIRLEGSDKVVPAYPFGKSQVAGAMNLRLVEDPKLGVTKDMVLKWSQRNLLVRDYPELGMVKMGDTVGYLNVMPHRQFHKGYYSPNVRLWTPNLDDIQCFQPGIKYSAAAPEVVWQVYNREYWHPSEAVRLMELGESVGYPLSRNFGTYLRKDFANPFLCYKRNTVGVYRGGAWQFLDTYKIHLDQFKRETQVEAS